MTKPPDARPTRPTLGKIALVKRATVGALPIIELPLAQDIEGTSTPADQAHAQPAPAVASLLPAVTFDFGSDEDTIAKKDPHRLVAARPTAPTGGPPAARGAPERTPRIEPAPARPSPRRPAPARGATPREPAARFARGWSGGRAAPNRGRWPPAAARRESRIRRDRTPATRRSPGRTPVAARAARRTSGARRPRGHSRGEDRRDPRDRAPARRDGPRTRPS